MFTKKSKVDEKDLVEVESQTLKEKCGACGGDLLMKVFWSKKGYQQKIECKEGGIGGWKSDEEVK
ncbi:MAG: hypothetical protein ACTSPT_01885 [Candidatus Heimdallarchaeota archaeon]